MTYEEENIKSGYYPSLSAFVRYGWQGQTNKLFSSETENKVRGTATGVLGLNLSIPIFDGFRKKNQLQQLRIRREQMALDRLNLTNSIRMQFDNAGEKLGQNKRLVAAQQQNMELAKELYGVTRLSYQEGVAPLTELLNAENSLNEAQTQYLNAMLNLKLAELDHLETSGQLAQIISENTDQ
jgi:outer membrane protein TolC